MFGHRFYGGRFYGPRYFGDGGDVAAVVAAETYSGGPREESRTEREARIHAERVKLGIIENDSEPPAALESQGQGGPFSAPLWMQAAGEAIGGVPATELTPETAGFNDGAYDAALGSYERQPEAGWKRSEMLARLHTSAYLDAEIRRHFELQDEDDAAVLLLAIAALH